MGLLDGIKEVAKDALTIVTGPAGHVVSTIIDAVGEQSNTPANTPVKTPVVTGPAKFYLPGIGGQSDPSDDDSPFQASPLLNTYSPRLFGAPPQLSNLCDMRLKSAKDDEHAGPVGDFYLDKVLKDANVVNIIPGHALFTGGFSSIAGTIQTIYQYEKALTEFDLYDSNQSTIAGASTGMVVEEYTIDSIKNARETDDGKIEFKSASSLSLTDVSENAMVSSDGETEGKVNSFINSIGVKAEGLATAFLTSLSVQQPFYTFEFDWSSYINNVKMMINAAIVMLGLQDAVVRIGDTLFGVGLDGKVTKDNDVWANYRFITPSDDLKGSVNGVNNMKGDSSQYVSFMIDPAGSAESYTNSVGESQIYSTVINQGNGIGNEIAFLANATPNAVDDAVLSIASESITAAENVISKLSGGVGRFTAAVASGMARSYVGDHTIYPQIFQSHTSTSNKEFTIHLVAPTGDPYTYLTDILVPMFMMMGFCIPTMSKNSGGAYTFPPVVQVSIPGLWGTRLGMITSVSITKNPSGKDFSVLGFPLSVDMQVSVTDLQHCMVLSPMDKPSMFLNNQTMFDYIAHCAGVDRYRINGSVRIMTKLALGISAFQNTFVNLGNGLKNDWTSLVNKLNGVHKFT